MKKQNIQEKKLLFRKVIGKIYDTINDISFEVKNSNNSEYNINIINNAINISSQKFYDYRCNKENIQESVNGYIYEIYENKKKETQNFFYKINNSNKNKGF